MTCIIDTDTLIKKRKTKKIKWLLEIVLSLVRARLLKFSLISMEWGFYNFIETKTERF